MLAPFVAFAIALVFFRTKHTLASGVVLAGGATSLVSTVLLLLNAPHHAELFTYRWLTIGGVDIAFGALVDGRSLIMGAIVGVITMAIMVYSLGYMSHDPGKGRFFSFLGLFESAMLSFVFAPNLLQAFIFWELVGLASFFLIGFWYEKPSAVAASKKAFIMTRIGDVGMMVGLLMLFNATQTFDILALTELFGAEGLPDGIAQGQVEWIAALLFLGVMGKSAQFPLHTWLPDAMEGPTPVSGLLHSATMVAAGVFLYARFHEVFMDAPGVSMVVLGIAAFTALMSSTIAMVAKDMKRVLAYSSISQLGFMLMALASGSLFAGMFHLTTHAIFKALLFLVAGSYIHEFGTNDMVAIGRAGGRKMTFTTIGLVAGGVALMGLPGAAGFFSKEAILHALHTPAYMPFMIAALAAAFMTAYYTSRMLFFILRPRPESGAIEEEPAGSQFTDDGHHGHGDGVSLAPWSMRGPILVLSVGALAGGLLGGPITHLLEIHAHETALVDYLKASAIPAGLVFAALGLAYAEFGTKASKQLGIITFFPSLHAFLKNGWYFDALYDRTVVAFSQVIAGLSFFVENQALDRSADKLAEQVMKVGGRTAKSSTGQVEVYVGTSLIVIAIVAFLINLTAQGTL